MANKPDPQLVECSLNELVNKLPQECRAVLSIFSGGVFWETLDVFKANMDSDDECLRDHKLERLLEVRAYSENGELHVWRDSITGKSLRGRLVSDEDVDEAYYFDDQPQYLDIDCPRTKELRKSEGDDCLYVATGGGRYALPGPSYTKVLVRNYLDYDEDGMCRVVDFRILGLE